MTEPSDTILITGAAGFIGHSLTRSFAADHRVVALDLKEPADLPQGADFVAIDLSADEGVETALAEVRRLRGGRIASAIHLAAYFDLSGEPDPKYEAVTVRGTQRLLRGLQSFEVEQFVFSSTMLVHEAGRPGETIDEGRPLDPKLPYRASKIRTEEVVHETRGRIPVVYLRPAGVYDDRCGNAFLAHQIARIHEGRLKGHLYPGDPETGQSFLHIDDLVDAVRRLVERRGALPEETAFLLGEPEVMGYGELQSRMGHLIHGEDWQTWEIPKALAKTGAWAEEQVPGLEPFTKPWMADIADDHYAVDVSRARNLLGWEPKHRLREALVPMIASLKDDPAAWYEANKLDTARLRGSGESR
jgi:nucleoside-diphosphate-sugar epimerase